MAQEPLVAEQIRAGEEFARDFNVQFPVSLAFWLNPVDSDAWYLYVASPGIDGSNLNRGYREVMRLFETRQFPCLDRFQIKLISADSEMAQHAVTIRNRYPAPLPTRLGETSIGGLLINEAYLYPSLALVSSPS